MGFLVFFFPSCLVAEKIPCLVAEKINIRQTFFFLLGHRMGPEVPWPNGARGARGAQKKNPFSKWAGSRLWVLVHGSGSDMEIPGSNPTRCHS